METVKGLWWQTTLVDPEGEKQRETRTLTIQAPATNLLLENPTISINFESFKLVMLSIGLPHTNQPMSNILQKLFLFWLR